MTASARLTLSSKVPQRMGIPLSPSNTEQDLGGGGVLVEVTIELEQPTKQRIPVNRYIIVNTHSWSPIG